MFEYRGSTWSCNCPEHIYLVSNLVKYVNHSFCLQLAIAKNNIIKLQEENQQLRSENTLILLKAQQHLEVFTTAKLDLSSHWSPDWRCSRSRWPRVTSRWKETRTNSLVRVWMRCTTRPRGSWRRSVSSDRSSRLFYSNGRATPGLCVTTSRCFGCFSGRRERAGSPGVDETGNGAGHETSGKRYSWKTGEQTFLFSLPLFSQLISCSWTKNTLYQDQFEVDFRFRSFSTLVVCRSLSCKTCRFNNMQIINSESF